MVQQTSHLPRRILILFIAAHLFVFAAFAQIDTDPNSPVPILLSSSESSSRVLAQRASRSVKTAKAAPGAFAPNSTIILYIRNISLLEGEGANAFRVYAEDSKGREYRFPVLDIEVAGGVMKNDIYALKVRLRDETGYAEPPATGDLLVRVAWRGLTSDRLRLGFGTKGGGIKDDAAPYSTLYSGSGIPSKYAPEIPTDDIVGYRWSGDRARFLEQATFGSTATIDSRVRRLGLRVWLSEQLEAAYPSASNPYPNFPLKSTDLQNATTGCGMFVNPSPEYSVCLRDHYTMYPVQKWFFTEAFYGEAQLRHRVVWSLSQIWVVSGVDTQQSRWMTEYNKVLSDNAFGNYRTLMKQMTLNPAMGNYLDMVRSTKNNPNENYARELLQLFSVGLFMLNPDGTQQMSGGSPIPTYDQNTVNAFTKVLTGFSLCETTASCPNRALGAPNYIDPLLLNQNNHDITAKTLLSYPGAVNQNIPAGLNGGTELDLALDNVFYHPNVGPFVSRLLIQHMVTSDPTPAYVGRVAAVFNNNGFSVRGDLKAVIKAILLDPEARGDVKTDPNYGKLREPVQLATNFLKAFNVRSADGLQPSDGVIASRPEFLNMGQNPFNSPTVFNYYSPDYVIPGTALNGPEFGIMTTSTSIARANYGNTMTFSRVNAAPPNIPLGTSIDFAEMEAIAASDVTGNLLVDDLNRRMMHGTMSAGMRNTIITAVTAIPPTPAANMLARARQAIYLVATSSQYQVQR
ncbi:MAG: DUF1800 domain-containing protein [Pyrinomonadaceae bacterium]